MTFEFKTLSNGVRVLLVLMPGVQSVAVGTFIQAGSRFETAVNNGISHFLEHMVFKGTKKFPSYTQTSYLEGLGGVQNAWTDVDATAYYCKLPADRWKEGLELVKELTLYPLLPEADLEIERGVILEEINRRDDRPDELVAEVLQQTMYRTNPLGQTVLGSPKVIKSLPKTAFVDYHSQQYVAKKLVVVLAGKLDTPAIQKAITEWFGQLESKAGPDFIPYQDSQEQAQVVIRNKALTGQAHIHLGFRGVNLLDPRRFALAILSSYLGQGLSSRLFVELREKRGLCYAVHTDDAKWTDTGMWGIYAGLNLEKLDQAIQAILNELKRVKDNPLSEAELIAAKEKIRGPLLFSMENPLHQMNFYARQALDRPEEIRTFEQIIDQIMQVTADQVQKVAQDIFLPHKLTLAVVGQLAKSDSPRLLKQLQV